MRDLETLVVNAPMRSGTDHTETANTYDLTCSDCTFEATVEGSVFDALDVADGHQESHGDTLTEHFVNFELNRGE